MKSVELKFANEKHCFILLATSLENVTYFGDRSKRSGHYGLVDFLERFTEGNFEGNFVACLKHFERCATKNLWDAETRAGMLPAFLQGPTTTYVKSVTEDQRVTYDTLVASLNGFRPDVNHERYYHECEDTTLHPPPKIQLSFCGV